MTKCILLAAVGMLAGCASTPPTQVSAPLPHNGRLTDLAGWWHKQGDPLLVQLIDASQAASPTLAAAQSCLAQSRAERVAALLRTLYAGISANQENAASMTT